MTIGKKNNFQRLERGEIRVRNRNKAKKGKK